MGFFSDLKEDLSMAVSELLPESDKEKEVETENTLQEEAQVETTAANEEEISKDDIADILANLTGTTVVKEDEPEVEMTDEELLNAAFAEAGLPPVEMEEKQTASAVTEEPVTLEVAVEEPVIEEPVIEEAVIEEPVVEEPVIEEPVIEEPVIEEPVVEEAVAEQAPIETYEEIKEEAAMVAPTFESKIERDVNKMALSHFSENETATDEKSIITEGMTINGDVISRGSLEVLGQINGNIDVLGKLDVSGTVNGDSQASEVYAENAKIVGEVRSLGSVKIGQSSVIIGNVTATSAVIAGAIKGDIDVTGPVILDTSAIVMGNIKSKSVQINNGAVIEGLCSQCYADVNPSAFFDEFKKSVKAN